MAFIKISRSKKCRKHNSVMTFGKYSSDSRFAKAHRIVRGHTYYCDSCIEEIIGQ